MPWTAASSAVRNEIVPCTTEQPAPELPVIRPTNEPENWLLVYVPETSVQPAPHGTAVPLPRRWKFGDAGPGDGIAASGPEPSSVFLEKAACGRANSASAVIAISNRFIRPPFDSFLRGLND